LQLIKTDSPISKPDYSQRIPFGLYHTDHMLEIDYFHEKGWQKPIISKYHNFSIDPRNSSLHYAIELFEGMKAYKSVKNKNEVILFRPEKNMERMNISASRIGLPV
jgi:branched-chain amino acid aminotransferase